MINDTKHEHFKEVVARHAYVCVRLRRLWQTV
jgi:hypothetical protein